MFEIGYNAFYKSRMEALEVINLYHNRQYTTSQELVLENRGQPKETFNVIKLFGRMLLGYYSTVVNEIIAKPKGEEDVFTASVLNDVIDYVSRNSNLNSEGEKIKLDALLVGLFAAQERVVDSGERDEFGRVIHDIKISHVPALELVLDPMSRLDDYSDARFIHRYKWVSEEDVIRLFGKDKVKKLQAYDNHVNVTEADFTQLYNQEFTGKYKVYDNYLVIHTVIKDENDKTWSIYWSGDIELEKKEITHKKVKFPYRVHKLHSSNIAEFYGIFREVIETQHAINQALLKIQLMVNTQKAFVQNGAVESLSDFTDSFYRVNSIIPVKDLNGIKIDNLSREILDQYTIIDKALDRIQRVLSVNDSFLGMAYASDSGSKVKLQQNASVVALRYVTTRVEKFYELLGWDILNLVQQYKTAHEALRVSDTYEGDRWVEINKPLQLVTGVDNQGNPITRYVYEEVLDPSSGKPMTDDNGNIIMAPIPTAETEIAFTKADIEVESVAYNDEDERNQVMLEQFMNGPMGSILSQVNPVGYFKAGKLAVKNIRSKYSPELANILDETAMMLGGNQQAMGAMMQGQINGQRSPEEASNQMPGRTTQGGR